MIADASKAKFIRRTGVVMPFATQPVGDLPALTGKVRPCSASDRGKFFDEEYPDLKKAHGHERAVAVLYARHLAEWDYFDLPDSPSPLPITPENVASLPPPVFDQLDRIVSGTQLGN